MKHTSNEDITQSLMEAVNEVYDTVNEGPFDRDIGDVPQATHVLRFDSGVSPKVLARQGRKFNLEITITFKQGDIKTFQAIGSLKDLRNFRNTHRVGGHIAKLK